MITHSTLDIPAAAAGRMPQPQAVTWPAVYDAAERADFRGYFYIPLEPAEQAPAFSRRILNERIDWLYKNVGAITMLIDGMALDEVGTGLWPKWTSSNPVYNTAMTDAFHQGAHDPRFFSASGDTDYYTEQFNIRRMIRLYGDCFGQLIRPTAGSIYPQCQLIPGYRIESDGNESSALPWRDGIQRSTLGRAINFKVKTGNDSAVVNAADMLHFHDPFLPGQNRGISCLASVARRLFRREDVFKAIANGTLARERLGFALEMGEDTGGPKLAQILGGAAETQTLANDDGTTMQITKIFGRQSADEIQIPRLPKGSKIVTVESNRPGTAVTDFLDSALRETAWAANYPPEYVFFLAGLGNGTVARLVMMKIRDIVRARRAFQLIPQFCNRWHVFTAWQLIKSGRFDKIEGGIPADWWKHKIRADGDKSVDVGREGRLYDDRVATGKMSIDAYHALSGEDAGDVEDENLERISERLAKLKKFNEKNGTKFDYFDLWPRSVNNQPTPADQPADTTTETPGKP